MNAAPALRNTALAFALVACGSARAQFPLQLVVDSALALGAAMNGYVTEGFGQVIRAQQANALEYRAFDVEGLPLWQRRFETDWSDWVFGELVPSGASGSIACSSPLLSLVPEQNELELALLAVDATGNAAWGKRLALGLPTEQPPAPRLKCFPSADQGIFILQYTVAPGDPVLNVLKVSANGELLWAYALSQSNAAGTTAWGDGFTRAAPDPNGGILLARSEQALGHLDLVHLAADGTLAAAQRLQNLSEYGVELYDLVFETGTRVLLLGRLAASTAPSGGMLMALNENWEVDRLTRYQFDIGRRLFLVPGNGAVVMDAPWIYRLQEEGEVLRAWVLQNWTMDTYGYTRSLNSLAVKDGMLWMQGVLQQILIQFNTQRIMPHFALHLLDDPSGCQLDEVQGFGFTRMDPASLAATTPAPVLLTDLLPSITWSDLFVSVSDLEARVPIDLCLFTVGLEEEGREPGFQVNGTVVEAGMPIQLSGLKPGVLSLHDAVGRVLWSGAVQAGDGRLELQPPTRTPGVYLIRWTAKDGSEGQVVRVVVG